MKKNTYYLKSNILNYINKKKYSLAKNLINLLNLNERKKEIYTYINDLINYLENPYELTYKKEYNYQTYDNFYKHFYEALRNKDYLEAYLTIKDEEYPNDFDKKIIKTLLKQIYDINRFKSPNINVIIDNILEFGITKEDAKLLKSYLKNHELNDYEYQILEILETKELLNGNSLQDFTCSLNIYNQNLPLNYELAMQYGDYFQALKILETNFYKINLNKNEKRKFEFIKYLLNNLLSNEEIKNKEQIKKEKYLNKKMKKINNLSKYVNNELFIRSMRYYKEQKRFFNSNDEIIYDTFFKYGISCLKNEFEIIKEETVDLEKNNEFVKVIENLDELKKYLKN